MTWLYFILVLIATFLIMEGVTWLTHKYVMHGFLWYLHRDHHQVEPGFFEKNDAFFVIFAVPSMLCIAFGVSGGIWWLAAIGFGIMAYGFAYFIVHDVYIHKRLRLFGNKKVAVLERLAAAHRLHHQFNSEPYGMLLPITGQRASGSTPSHVPAES